MTQRRFLLINYEYPPVGGGGGNATRHIAQELAQRGHAVFVLTAAWDKLPLTEIVNGVTIRRLPALRQRADRSSFWEMLAFLVSALLSAPGWARQWKVDAVLTFFALPCGPIGALLKRTNHLPYAVSLQGGDVPGFGPDFMPKYLRLFDGPMRKVWRDANAVVANSNGLADMARRFDAHRPIEVIPAGADISGIVAKTDYTSGRDVALLFVGRLVRQKGLDVLLAALAKLPLALRWRLTFVGDGPEWPALAGQASQLGLSDRITLEGWVTRDALPNIYGAADLFVLPSREEGMPNALLEAMAAGLPVLGTRVTGTAEAVIDRETGWLVDSDNAEQLADALRELITDAPLRARLGQAGRARVEAELSWRAVTDQWETVLERIVSEGVPQKGTAS